MASFLDLIAVPTATAIRDTVRGFAVSAGLKINNWRSGGIGQQMLEWQVAATDAATRMINRAVRGYASLDTSVDPGDVDAYDANNETLEPAPGFLSSFGANTFDTTRIEQTFASGSVVFTNNGVVARTFLPYGLTFTWTVSPPSGRPPPTYRNVEDATVYTDPGGTVTVPVGGTVTLPVQCDFAGSLGSCPSDALTLTTTMIGCTASNTDPVVGNDRESVELYRERCRKSSARLSLGGPAAIYEYLANTNLDGSPLYNAAAVPAPVGITRTQVSTDSTTGIVTVYYATASGAPIAADVTAANLNIEQNSAAVGDCVTFTGIGAAEATVDVAGTVKIKNASGLDVSAIKSAIVLSLANLFQTIPISGHDPNSVPSIPGLPGFGVLYLNDIEAAVKNSYPGLYAVTTSAPTANLLVPNGVVMVLNSTVSDWIITVVS